MANRCTDLLICAATENRAECLEAALIRRFYGRSLTAGL
jgi:hypothetical protein